MVPPRLQYLLDESDELARRFAVAGKQLYLVGGTVRDAIAGRPGGVPFEQADFDYDCTTDALPDEIEAIVAPVAEAIWLQGKRFGTIGCAIRGRRFEITTHRAEVYRADSRKPEVVFGSEILADLSRRDFTVNAMALRLGEGQPELIDPFDGVGDLMNGRRLRTPIVSAERIRDELNKLVELPDPEAGLWFVVDSGLAAEFLPELPALALEQDPIHRHKDVLAHTIAVVGKTRPDRVLRLAALFHDVGKPRTRSIGEGGVHFHHHDVVGARMTERRMAALKYSNAEIADVVRLVELHLRFHTYKMGWTDSALRRFANDAGPLLDRLNELTRADCTTRNQRRVLELEARMDELERRLGELRAHEALEALRPELDGQQVMARLGLEPGPLVGRALAYLLEIRLNEGLLGAEEVTRRLDAWWEGQGGG